MERGPEGELYEKQGPLDGVARLYSFEDVHVDGKVDSTPSCQRTLEATGWPACLRKRSELSASRADKYFTEFLSHNSGPLSSKKEEVLEWMELLEVCKDPRPVCPLVHCRLLLKTFGYPLIYFTSIKELMQVFIDAVKGDVEFKYL